MLVNVALQRPGAWHYPAWPVYRERVCPMVFLFLVDIAGRVPFVRFGGKQRVEQDRAYAPSRRLWRWLSPCRFDRSVHTCASARGFRSQTRSPRGNSCHMHGRDCTSLQTQGPSDDSKFGSLEGTGCLLRRGRSRPKVVTALGRVPAFGRPGGGASSSNVRSRST